MSAYDAYITSDPNHTLRKCDTPHAFIDTFWARQRVSRNLTIRDMGAMIGYSEKTFARFLTGQSMPPDSAIQALCNIFDIEYEVGKAEFEKAAANWKPNRRKHVNKKDVLSAQISESVIDNIADILYGKIPYSKFKLVIEYMKSNSIQAVKELIYGYIDFDTYQCISKELKEKSNADILEQ